MDQQEEVDLRDVIDIDADSAGSVYALTRLEDGEYRIAVIDGRQEVLDEQQRQGRIQGPVRLCGVRATQIIYTQPAIDFEARALHVTPSGRYLVVHGVSRQDSTVLEVAVVDLHGGQPLPSPARGRAPSLRGATPPPPAPSATRHRQCRLHPVDPGLFSSRPGLLLLQASWHPHSEAHLLLLTSDNRLRLYHVTHTLAVAEQTLHLMPQSGPVPQRYGLAGAASSVGTPGSPAYGLAAAGVGAPLATDIVAFAFGPAVGWGLFSLLAMAADGHVYAVGPVAPFGMRCSSALLERLAAEGPAASAWLEAAFGAEAVAALGQPGAKARWPVLPHVLDGASPALVGPLNPRALGELPAPPSAAKAVALAASHAVARGAAGHPRAATTNGHTSPAMAATDAGPSLPSATVSTVAVGFSDGRLLAYAMAGPWVPAWCDVDPQYLPAGGVANGTGAGSGSAPAAVRYTCVLRTGGEAGAGTSVAAAATTAAAAVTPRMALLDVVELPVAGDGGAGGAAGAAQDSDDEDGYGSDGGYGGGVAAAGGGRHRAGMVLHVQCGVAAAGGGGGGVSVGGGAATVWSCVRSGGCWGTTLPWSAQLPQWLGEGGVGLPAELPSPLVTCVHEVGAATGSVAGAAPGAPIAGSCLLANPLLGGGLLLLTASGSLQYHQPAGAAALLAHQQRQQQVAPAASPQQRQQPAGTKQPAAAAASTTSPPVIAAGGAASANERAAAVEAAVQERYGHLLAPPQDAKLAKPPAGAPSPLTTATPEGLRHLTGAIAAMRGSSVRFVHGAHLDLEHRAEALQAEAARHAVAAAELSATAGSLEARQAALEARLARLAALHANMVERAGMLASLHWSLPRALSHAERSLRGELDALEGRGMALQEQWRVMEQRARRLCEARRVQGADGPGGAPGTVRMASVPESQLDKVHDAVVAQYRGLTAARAALAALEQHVSAARADRAVDALDRGLALGMGASVA